MQYTSDLCGFCDLRWIFQEGSEKAKKLLQERGVAKAAKKSDREAADGLVATYVHATGKIAGMVELFCETDFVARTEDFQKLSKEFVSV